MTEKITIVGAGLSGLIAGAMLRDRLDCIIETRKAVPNRTDTLLRFRNLNVAEALNVEFQEVEVVRDVQPTFTVSTYANAVSNAIAYSKKTLGEYHVNRSIVNIDPRPVKRYIAPPDLVDRLVKMIGEDRIVLSETFNPQTSRQKGPIISTIPMDETLGLFGIAYEPGTFRRKPMTYISGRVPNCNAYATVYLPDPFEYASRVSVTGDQYQIEIPGYWGEGKDKSGLTTKQFVSANLRKIGINIELPDVSAMRMSPYGKIANIPNSTRLQAITALTDKFGVYVLGRYATWRPGLLLDDIPQDVRLIGRMIENDPYPSFEARSKARGRT